MAKKTKSAKKAKAAKAVKKTVLDPVELKAQREALALKHKGENLTVDFGNVRDKTKDLVVVAGVTTVAEAVRLGGHTVPGDKTAKQENWRLRGKVCEWTDVIQYEEDLEGNADTTLWKIPETRAGAR